MYANAKNYEAVEYRHLPASVRAHMLTLELMLFPLLAQTNPPLTRRAIGGQKSAVEALHIINGVDCARCRGRFTVVSVKFGHPVPRCLTPGQPETSLSL